MSTNSICSTNSGCTPSAAEAERDLDFKTFAAVDQQEKLTMELSSNASFEVLGQDGNEMNDDGFGLNENGQNGANNEQQQLKELREKVTKLEVEKKILEEKLKQHELMDERNALMEKVFKMEQEQLKTNQQQKEDELAAKKLQKGLIAQQNCWNVNACHSNLEIIGTMVTYKGGTGSISVFSKYGVLSSDSHNFYFEIVVKNVKNFVSIGLATKKMPLYEKVGHHHLDSYGYQSDGTFWVNGTKKSENAKFGNCDVVGCGFNFATRQIIFTKNGQCLEVFFTNSMDFSTISSSSSAENQLFPIASLCDFGDQLKANFGPNFNYDPANFEAFSIPKGNCWDANICHIDLQIIDDVNLTIHHKGNGNGWRTVFAKYSILNTSAAVAHSVDIFYFEILVKNVKNNISFGIAIKHQYQASLAELFYHLTGVYAYLNNGYFYVNRSSKSGNEQFGIGDTVGFGVNLATKQLFITKNGQRMGSTNLSIFSSSVDHQLFPFVSLPNSDDKIEANFGPKFKFDLTIL